VAQPWRRAARVRRSGMQVPVRIFRVVPRLVRCGMFRVVPSEAGTVRYGAVRCGTVRYGAVGGQLGG
jgi:hypothetical protein